MRWLGLFNMTGDPPVYARPDGPAQLDGKPEADTTARLRETTGTTETTETMVSLKKEGGRYLMMMMTDHEDDLMICVY
jgi:hypothetical protein